MEGFNAYDWDPSQGSGQLPIGKKLDVVIKGATPEKSASKTSGFLKLDIEVVSGEHAGAEGVYRLNLWNDNEKTVEIAHKQYSALCHVTGRFQIRDKCNPVELFGIPFKIDVVSQNNPDHPEYTKVQKVYDTNGNEPGRQSNQGSALQGMPAQMQNQQPAQMQQPVQQSNGFPGQMNQQPAQTPGQFPQQQNPFPAQGQSNPFPGQVQSSPFPGQMNQQLAQQVQTEWYKQR